MRGFVGARYTTLELFCTVQSIENVGTRFGVLLTCAGLLRRSARAAQSVEPDAPAEDARSGQRATIGHDILSQQPGAQCRQYSLFRGIAAHCARFLRLLRRRAG